jgi:hypothetical protein
MNDGTPHDDRSCAAHEVRYLPDAPLGDDTEFVFIDQIAFVNAHKHEEVVAHHVAENERLREALRVIRGPEDKDHEFECDAELRQLRAEQQGDRHAISILDIDNERLRALADGRLQLLRAERKGYEAEIKRLRELVRELRQFIPYEKPEQGPLPAWIVDIAERAEEELAQR